ncbi:MAG: hypothetical protein JW841_15135 [Deltaproteobacteria bacterium]|nr:hypothetical protein [Deltaproteobacteria bacterium]
MRSVLLDKRSSVTLNCHLSREVRLATDISASEGSVVAVRVLTSKSTYNQLELVSGRFSTIKPGDVCAVCLGHRKALFGYAGHLPDTVSVGDHLHILNLGGVLGVCDSINPDFGEPFVCEVLGQILHFPYLGERIGIPANINQGALPLNENITLNNIPVVAVVGSSMGAGKTAAACALVQSFTHKGLNVAAGKATGVSLRRDILSMNDAGAQQTLIFTDFGIVTTTTNNAPLVTRSLLSHLATQNPDVIVIELGDGLLGLYGVDSILADPELRQSFSAVVLAASDPVAAWGGVHLLDEQYGLKTAVVTGPATDNTAGINIVETQTKVTSFNARTNADDLSNQILIGIGLS